MKKFVLILLLLLPAGVAFASATTSDSATNILPFNIHDEWFYVVIVVIAADDNVMPQTKEAINHAQVAGVPMIFAINKMDRPNANADKIKEELSQINILVEDWGGKYQSQEISAADRGHQGSTARLHRPGRHHPA